MTGQAAIPVRGDLSATAHVTGTPRTPVADLSFTLAHGNVYEEPIDQLQGTVRYSNKSIDIPSLQFNAPAGRVTLHGSWDAGMAKAQVDGTDIRDGKDRACAASHARFGRHSPSGDRCFREPAATARNAGRSDQEVSTPMCGHASCI